MTEEKAKTKWCPMRDQSGLTCIGSACMAWRWENQIERSERLEEMRRSGTFVTLNDAERWGFCGLAGRP